MSEIFYSDAGIKVTASVVHIGSETFSTPNITSVRVKSPDTGARVLVLLLFAAFAVNLFRAERYLAGVVCLFIASLPFIAKSKLYIATAGGERKALLDSAARCNAVRAAIVNAMQAQTGTRQST